MGMFANWTSNFIVTLTFLSVVAIVGAANTFWLFAGIIGLGMIFIYRMAPETKGKSLESVERYWMDGRKWTDDVASNAPHSVVD